MWPNTKGVKCVARCMYYRHRIFCYGKDSTPVSLAPNLSPPAVEFIFVAFPRLKGNYTDNFGIVHDHCASVFAHRGSSKSLLLVIGSGVACKKS